jgi:hypothetical protein
VGASERPKASAEKKKKPKLVRQEEMLPPPPKEEEEEKEDKRSLMERVSLLLYCLRFYLLAVFSDERNEQFLSVHFPGS